MKAKQVYLTGKERLTVQTLISIEIRWNLECEKMDTETAFDTETLKALYKKLSGFDWTEH